MCAYVAVGMCLSVCVCVVMFSLIRFKYNEISNEHTQRHTGKKREKYIDDHGQFEYHIWRSIVMRSCMFKQSTALMRDQNPCILTVSFHPLIHLLSRSFIYSFIYTNECECDSPRTYIHTHIPHDPTIIPTAHMLTAFSQSFHFLSFSVRCACMSVFALIIWYSTHSYHNRRSIQTQLFTFTSFRFIPFKLVRLFSQIYIHIRLNVSWTLQCVRCDDIKWSNHTLVWIYFTVSTFRTIAATMLRNQIGFLLESHSRPTPQWFTFWWRANFAKFYKSSRKLLELDRFDIYKLQYMYKWPSPSLV